MCPYSRNCLHFQIVGIRFFLIVYEMVAFSYCGILLHFSMVVIDCIFLLWKLLHVRIVGIGFIQFHFPIVRIESLFLLRELVEFNIIFHTVEIRNLLHSNPFSNCGNWFLPF